MTPGESNSTAHTVHSEEPPVYGVKRSVTPGQRLQKASYYSYKGLRTTFQQEQAFRFECYALAAAVPLSYLIANSALDYLMLLGSVVMVMIVELLNTGIEMIVDRVGREHNELSGRAKDAGSAAVFLAILLAMATWLVIAIT
ncbi:diacylglycerol kinase [Halioxenophilus sp. WMMB6]|uniref:diacylglycerol kinase n=1 Tax=Halioxenophilus sp. WMMB6 TaxID=3073815 RepID=UPI00295EBDC5|nr:diacylglycerol kinase [Halioxenophilus sp. WMMB6]